MNLAEELRAAADRLRGLATAVPTEHWGSRPWHVEECSDTDTMESCLCIVAQGEYREFDQPQIPPVQYIADAETREHAAYIAAMHPGVGTLLAQLLEIEADVVAVRTAMDGTEDYALDGGSDYLLDIARLINAATEATA
ncbi:hypothetical protein [Streptomyces sp. NPDC085596]|uniref:hypothetical protein n=1 Tax=Streptomyces sp. NPDC085596 TaxID=3365731 RepID=UPI0037D40C70